MVLKVSHDQLDIEQLRNLHQKKQLSLSARFHLDRR
jgi:hypothetical protein